MSNVSTVSHDKSHDKGHGSIKSYIVGFLLSILLTIIPYYSVVSHSIALDYTYIIILTCAVLQLIIQLVFFLHLGTGVDKEWNTIAFIFTVFVLLILVVGSLWIMYNLDYNMMEHIN